MRDFKAGRDIKILGDVNITDGAKPLSEWDTPTLQAELVHRRKIARRELFRRLKFTGISFLVAIIGGVGIAIWYHVTGRFELATFIVAALAVLLPAGLAFGSLANFTEVERRQKQITKEIKLVLMERE